MGFLKLLGIEPEKDPIAVRDDTFASEVIRSDLPVVLDIWSGACQPCVKLAPTIKKLAAKYDGRVKVCQMNVADGMKTAASLGVRGTPTVLFFKNGKVVERAVGFRGQLYYEEIVETDLLDSQEAGS